MENPHLRKIQTTLLLSLLALSATAIIAPSVAATSPSCVSAGSTGLTAKVVLTSGQMLSGTVDATGCDVGIFVGPGTTGVVISGATVTGANDHGIFVQDSSHIKIVDSVVTGNQVSTHGDCTPGQPPTTGCIAEDKAIELVGTSHSSIIGNTVSYNMGSPGGGIGVSDDGSWDPGAPFGNPGNLSPSNFNMIADNAVTHNMADCQIVVSSYDPGAGVSHNTLMNNTISVGVTGIVVAADTPGTIATYNLVIGNSITDEFIPGIIIHSNAPGDIVSHNSVTNNILSNNGPDSEVGDLSNTGIVLVGAFAPVTHSVVNHNTISNEGTGIWACNTVRTPMNGNAFSSVDTPISSAPTC